MLNYLIVPFQFLYTVYVAIVWLIAFFCHTCFAEIYSLFFKDKKRAYMLSSKPFIWVALWITGVRIRRLPGGSFPNKGPFIVATNHQSHFDIAIFFLSCPGSLLFFAKKELLKVPFLGRDLKMMGHFMVDRTNARTAHLQMKTVIKALKQGASILVFPEGTRSPDGQLHAFKRGAFSMAIESGVPILPCYVEGTINIMSKKSMLLKPGVATLLIGDLIDVPKDISNPRQATIALMNQTKSAIEELQKKV